jgi:UDP-apiose/xylose synthase
MRILTLGAGGFIGSHLTQRLLERGHTVVGVDTHKDKLAELFGHDNFTFLAHDIRDPRYDLSASIGEADLVIDLIAHANPGIYIKRPLDVFYLNFNENLRIAEACVRHTKRLIQFSSCEVYGKTAAAAFPDAICDPEDPALATFTEETTNFTLGPVGKHRWIYACAKQLLERVIHAYGLSGQLQYTIIRPFNFIGPKIDYLPSAGAEVPRVFSYFMEALILGTRMVLVDGGTHRRCYTYIDDAIECVERIVENPNGVCDGQIFNIGSPANEISIRTLAETMCRIYQREFSVPGVGLPEIVEVSGEEFYGNGYEDSDRRIPDITKAETLLKWGPTTGIDELLDRTMRYYVEAYKEAMPAASVRPDPGAVPGRSEYGHAPTRERR